MGLVGSRRGPRRVSLLVQAWVRDSLRVSLRGGVGLVQVGAMMVVVLIQARAEVRVHRVQAKDRAGWGLGMESGLVCSRPGAGMVLIGSKVRAGVGSIGSR